jgi:hypothetical protein
MRALPKKENQNEWATSSMHAVSEMAIGLLRCTLLSSAALIWPQLTLVELARFRVETFWHVF